MCFLNFSGLSPFLDETIEETTANVLKCDYSFPDEFFGLISHEAKSLISRTLIVQPSLRISAHDAINSSWFHLVSYETSSVLLHVQVIISPNIFSGQAVN